MSYQSINPATGETSQTFEETTEQELESALAMAATCFESWRSLTFAERAVIASKAAAILRSRPDEFARPMTLEMGKRFEEVLAEVQLSADIVAYYAEDEEDFLALVALIFRVKDEDEAVALANDSDYGLSGAIFTKDVPRGQRLASRIETGMVLINHPTWTARDLPFGGIKNSGYGREFSKLGIGEFVNRKLVRTQSIAASVS